MSPGCSLEGLKLKLQLQYFGHLMWRADSLEKILMLGGLGGRRRRGRQRMRWLDGITNLMGMGWVDSGSWWWTGRPGVLWFMGSQRVGHDWATELNHWHGHQLKCSKKNSFLYNWFQFICPTSGHGGKFTTNECSSVISRETWSFFV